MEELLTEGKAKLKLKVWNVLTEAVESVKTTPSKRSLEYCRQLKKGVSQEDMWMERVMKGVSPWEG